VSRRDSSDLSASSTDERAALCSFSANTPTNGD
jgi:hypothetical protein